MADIVITDNTSELYAQELLALQGIACEITGLFRLTLPIDTLDWAVQVLISSGISCDVA